MILKRKLSRLVASAGLIAAILFTGNLSAAEAIYVDAETVEFESAYHAFDHPGIDTIDAGHIVRSDSQAAAEASQMSREFLQEWL